MSNLKSEILAAEQAWVEAHRTLNTAVLEAMLHPDYTQIQSDGSVLDRATVLASYRSGERHWTTARSDQYDLRLIDDTTAVLTGRWRGVGVNHGRSFDYWARFQVVYKKNQHGRWQIISDSSTPISPPNESTS